MPNFSASCRQTSARQCRANPTATDSIKDLQLTGIKLNVDVPDAEGFQDFIRDIIEAAPANSRSNVVSPGTYIRE
jgi:hypothetical protein